MTDPIRTLLARVKELDEKATDGPWVMDPESVSDNGLHYRPARVYAEGWTGYPVNDACEISLPTNNEDADLIAEYRHLAPQLARALEAVLEVCGHWEEWGHAAMSEAEGLPEDMAVRMQVDAGRLINHAAVLRMAITMRLGGET
ncbi:hypothetical protein [Citricoccus sp. NR2]|uniref:hypothetical protein n=1 Tax=Citricoccus sp. NR2 TaxID=3004095 RepID=UPI0022DDCF25|nr:hypothetical protein [Citricoccus sp. NR2]WBL18501.1 hypothetical protein O1A05_12135 [Citricoccus sp. NR2]